MERRLAKLESRIAVDMRELEQRTEILWGGPSRVIAGQRVDAGAVELRQSMARMVSEQVDLQMDVPTDALQQPVEGRLAASARMMDFIGGIGQVCRQASEHAARGSDENPPPADVPLVSSLILTVAGLLAMHYL